MQNSELGKIARARRPAPTDSTECHVSGTGVTLPIRRQCRAPDTGHVLRRKCTFAPFAVGLFGPVVRCHPSFEYATRARGPSLSVEPAAGLVEEFPSDAPALGQDCKAATPSVGCFTHQGPDARSSCREETKVCSRLSVCSLWVCLFWSWCAVVQGPEVAAVLGEAEMGMVEVPVVWATGTTAKRP